MSRPWEVNPENWRRCIFDPGLFPKWLRERGGIVVYENQLLDSSSMGNKTFMPAKFYAEGHVELQDAPEQFSPDGNCSTIQVKVDHITVDEYGGDLDLIIGNCFRRGDDG